MERQLFVVDGIENGVLSALFKVREATIKIT